MTPEEWGYSVVGALGPSEREVHLEIVRRVAEAVQAHSDERVAQAYEEAARVAESYSSPDQMLERYPDDLARAVIYVSSAIADAIRALKP